MARYDQTKHHRRSIRLKGYDYTQAGAYFVTLVTFQREMLFGRVVKGEMQLSPQGKIVVEEWQRTAEMRPNVRLDEFVVMPNHVHGIIWITNDDDANVGAHSRAPLLQHAPPHRAPKSLGSIIAGVKSIITKRINAMRGTPGIPAWQRNYYERIIRNERELHAIRQYIRNNPTHWAEDTENPDRVRS